MAQSSIKIKPCKFPNCLYYPSFGGDGYCWRHQSSESKSAKNATIYTAKKERKRRDADNKNLPGNVASLGEWFTYHIQNSKRQCDNCGADLWDYGYMDWSGSQHHILNKDKFPSVKTNLLNHLVLGMYCCHSQWHTSEANASKMTCFPLAEQIVIKLFPLLTYEEIKKIPYIYTL